MFPVLGEDVENTIPVIKQENLSHEEVQGLQELLKEFADIFATSLKNQPRCKIAKHHINTGDAFPIKCWAYQTSEEGHKFIKEEVQRMLEANIICPSASP